MTGTVMILPRFRGHPGMALICAMEVFYDEARAIQTI
jgi:hypothetical protein